MPVPASITDATVALRRRRSKSRRRGWRRIVVGVLLLALVATSVWLVGFSSVLAVKSVTVEGTQVLSPAQVNAVAAVPMGRPLARVDTEAIAERVRTMAPVREVEISRSWPNTLTITVAERTAVLQRRDGASYHWVDAMGTSFHQQAAPRDGLLTVQAPGDQRLLRDLATVEASLTAALRKRVHHVRADTPDTITLVLDRKQSVIWGSADQSETKAKVATAMLGVKATVFDVSAPANPTSR